MEDRSQAASAALVPILGNRRSQSRRRAACGSEVCATRSFKDPPPVIPPAIDDVNFFDLALTDVAGIEEAGDSIEGESPRIPESQGIDFLSACSAAQEGISRWRRISLARILPTGIDAENFPQQLARILSAVLGLPDDACLRGGLELWTITCRARIIGGHLVVSCVNQSGTVVSCMIPESTRHPRTPDSLKAR